MSNYLKTIVEAQAKGQHKGIFSVCTANFLVIEASLIYGKENNIPILIEATANQVNQFGGYTGMTPEMFHKKVTDLAREIDFPEEQLILGGDHLGPLVWRHEDADRAMEKAKNLVRDYVLAGFRKIHIDTSMPLGDDMASGTFGTEIIAKRSAELAKVCHEAEKEIGSEGQIVYVVGSEVPIPGGSTENEDHVSVTNPDTFLEEYKMFLSSWSNLGVPTDHIVGFVVQPGVEFSNYSYVAYDKAQAKSLVQAKKAVPEIVFEGHSTDYQTEDSLYELVDDGIAILKVGPELTSVLREALFSLEMILRELPDARPVDFRETLDQAMVENPKNWESYYHGNEEEIRFQRAYGMSDRCRYYLDVPEVKESMEKLLESYDACEVPIQLLSQYFPNLLPEIKKANHALSAKSLVMKHVISQSLRRYDLACRS